LRVKCWAGATSGSAALVLAAQLPVDLVEELGIVVGANVRVGRCGRFGPGPDGSVFGVRTPIPRQASAITRTVTAIATSMYIGHLLLL